MGAPFVLTLLSADGYQVFAALHQEFATLEEAIAGAKADYHQRYGGHPAFRVYHAESGGQGGRHTLIEVCFDESKRRSFVALYKVLQDVEPATSGGLLTQAPRVWAARAWRRLRGFLETFVPEPRIIGLGFGGC